jgi:ubiquinone/menaquinone biosynthesis C-methylase UbiE
MLMPDATNQAYLLNQQYCSADNLKARIELHERYSTQNYPWQRWVFDPFKMPPQASVLELGCGTGKLWTTNLDRIPTDWKITLSDFSEGMLRATENQLKESNRFEFANFDAQAMPYPDASFDAIIANHMLYHLPDRKKGLTEIRRVLKPGGHFYAATNGLDHLQELGDLMVKFFDHNPHPTHARAFSLANGRSQLEAVFTSVELFLFEGNLHVTEAVPVVNYIASYQHLTESQKNQIIEYVETEIARQGYFFIRKNTGLFIAC